MNPIPPHPLPLSIDSVLETLPERPIESSRSRDWGGATLDVFGAARLVEFRAPVRDHHLVGYCPSGSARLVQARAGVVHDKLFGAGMTLIMPAGYDSLWDGFAPRSVRLRMPVGMLEQAAEQAGVRPAAQFELRNVFETRDPTIERIAQVLSAELRRDPHPAQRLIADTLSCALAAHLLRSYNAFEFPDDPSAVLLGAHQLARLNEYIEERLESPLGLDELAKVVGFSKFYFARIFKRSTGVTAIRYVEQCRIRRAQSLIQQGKMPLVEVALLTGFADQSHFTRRFHQQVGCTPGAYARNAGYRCRAGTPA